MLSQVRVDARWSCQWARKREAGKAKAVQSPIPGKAAFFGLGGPNSLRQGERGAFAVELFEPIAEQVVELMPATKSVPIFP